MKKLNILVFPCGSEIGLEVHRSLRYSRHINLIGANSIDDHGKFVYENYIGNIPFIDTDEIILRLKNIVHHYNIDAIYPAMDKVIWKIKHFEKELGCPIISSNCETTEICLSKSKTYSYLKDIVLVPKVLLYSTNIQTFPVFIKPDIGYGSRGIFKANSLDELNCYLSHVEKEKFIITEYLPGKEYTVDCFTDRHGNLLYSGVRERYRISNGISVNTFPVINKKLKELSGVINKIIKFRGAWFFQAKENDNQDPVIIEIAARLGGSSSVHRNLGVNFALLSIFDAFDTNVKIDTNNYSIVLDRALDNKYKIDIDYRTVYVDFDDCLLINSKLNIQLIRFLYEAFSSGKRLTLITKHINDIHETLKKVRLITLFDEIISLNTNERKSDYITDKESIFIDDSFEERSEVKRIHKIPVFSPDMVESLLN